YYYMIGCAKREQWSLIKYIYLIPFYWLLISWSGFIAFYQLIFKPHYWEKTIHGLHLTSVQKEILAQTIVEEEEKQSIIPLPRQIRKRLVTFIERSKTYVGGIFLVGASITANFLNFGFNAYLGRVLKLEDFALISLMGGFLSFASILFGAFATSANYRSGFLIGKYGDGAGYAQWRFIRKRGLIISIIIGALWLFATPILMHNFDAENPFVFITFALILFVGLANGADRGFISAKLMFGSLAIINFVDPIVKFLSAIILVYFHKTSWTFAAIPLSVFATFITGYLLVVTQIKQTSFNAPVQEIRKFSKKFFTASFLTSFSSIVFMSMDIIMANHYLSSFEAGKYALLSLVGKMIYFLGGLTTPFVVPLLSRNEGANKDTKKTLHMLLLSTSLLAGIGFICFGIFGSFSIPLLYGAKAETIVTYLLFFGFGMTCFTVSKVFINYYLVKRMYTFTVVASFLGVLQFVLLVMFHKNAASFAYVMTFVWTLHLLCTLTLHLFAHFVRTIERNTSDFLGLFFNGYHQIPTNQNRILIFNWRDTKHKWAGGAEVYIHELAKRWVKEGNQVTIFCGNDGHRSRNEILDGIQIVRRGGFYSVYIWAFLYYILKFRGNYDIIIDSENGIPFFTPLYTNTKTFLLIHHVHQEVFRKSLRPPFSWLALFLEARAMPFIYKKTQVITVSPSSKADILKHKLTKQEPIIVYNGVDLHEFNIGKKNIKPLVLYVGRLQYYKSLNVFIKAAKQLIEEGINADFIIAGEGDEKNRLQKYANELEISPHIQFLGKIDHKEKIKLFQKAWVFVNPSFMEGWGITTIEAAACGTPTVASNVPGLKDSIKHKITGILVSYGDTKNFANAIREIVENKKMREKMSKASWDWAQNFSWEESSRIFMHTIQRNIRDTIFQKNIQINTERNVYAKS
ncbi:MAG TPA: glycosyltransferase, partial [Candidatus Eisenbacteria bacterium]|nr:glycosyltransferase [Candidatus Eisenbacteria bacterium]